MVKSTILKRYRPKLENKLSTHIYTALSPGHENPHGRIGKINHLDPDAATHPGNTRRLKNIGRVTYFAGDLKSQDARTLGRTRRRARGTGGDMVAQNSVPTH